MTLLSQLGALLNAAPDHDHGIAVPFTIGPLALRVFLLASVSAVAGFALLRAFLSDPDRRTRTWVAALAATAVLLELLLSGGIDLPPQAAVLVLAALAVPVYVAGSRRDGPAAATAHRLAPWVLTLAGGGAAVEFARAWLGARPPDLFVHTGLILALTGLSWLTLGLPRSWVVRAVVQVEAALLAAAAIAGAGQTSVPRPPDPQAPRAAAGCVVEVCEGKESSMIPRLETGATRSVLEEMTSLMIAVPSVRATSGEEAAWYGRKARLLDRIAAAGGPDGEFVRDQAGAAHRHAARLLRDAA